jgi:hypothetical protein
VQRKSYIGVSILLLLVLIGGYSLIAQRRAAGDRSGDKYFPAEHSKNITEDAQQAKQKGLSEIYIPAPKVTWVGAENIDTILTTDSVVFAKLADKESAFYDSDKTAIVTWLRFDVIQHIAGPSIPSLPPPSNVPEELTRNFHPSSTFFVRVLGGTLYQDGVKVIGDGPFSDLTVGNNFVLFAFFDADTEQALAGFNFGPQCVIPVDATGALSNSSGGQHAVGKFIAENQLRDVKSLKAALRTRAQALGQ